VLGKGEVMKMDLTKITIDNTDKTVDKYVVTRANPSIVSNHLNRFINNLDFKYGYILDLGCGHGRDCKYFEDKGFFPIGIDLSEKMLDVARNSCNKSLFLNMDMRNIGKILWKFDGVWSCGSLYHLKKNEIFDVLLKIYRILKTDGIFFIAVKEGEGEKLIYKNDLGVEKFYSLFSKVEIVDMLRDANFEILNIEIEAKKDMWINILAKKKNLFEDNRNDGRIEFGNGYVIYHKNIDFLDCISKYTIHKEINKYKS